jgi:hypothetical protein
LLSSIESALAEELPPDWWRLPVMPIGADDCQRFDESFATGYREAASELSESCPEIAMQWRNASPFTDIDVWRATLATACDTLNGCLLADLVFPPQGGDFLLNTSMERATIDELATLLMEWRRAFLPNHRSSEPWTIERFKTCLALLLQPQSLRKASWDAAIEAFAVDRTCARAIAFVAWRVGQLEMLDNTASYRTENTLSVSD